MSDEVISKGNLISVKSVKPLADYKLLLEFSTGEKRIYDVKPLLPLAAFAPLTNKELFKKVHTVYNYTIAWNNEIDMCPDALYEDSRPMNQ